jgi:hypothetical protein
MGMTGYQVSPAVLQQAAKGIEDTIDDLKGLGVEGTADAGRGFAEMALTGVQVGHSGVQGAFGQFLDRWSWGVRGLVEDGNAIAKALDLNAGVYYDAEKYASGTFKDITADVMGNPHLSDQQVEQESWAQVAQDNPINDVLNPDFSAKSMAQAGQQIEQTWKQEGRDLAGGPFGLGTTVIDATGHGQAFQQGEDAVFGPEPGAQQRALPD